EHRDACRSRQAAGERQGGDGRAADLLRAERGPERRAGGLPGARAGLRPLPHRRRGRALAAPRRPSGRRRARAGAVGTAALGTSVIALSWEGAESMSVDASGALVMKVDGGEVRQAAPVLYQETEHRKQQITGQFAVAGGRVGVQVGAYDASKPLVIDPVLT